MGYKITELTAFNQTPSTSDLIPVVDVSDTTQSANGTTKKMSIGDLSNSIRYTINAPEGFLINGKIIPTVTSNNLTLTLQNLGGATPDQINPVYVRLDNAVREITSAVSITLNAGTNWFNSGGNELATNEVDYFIYLAWDSTDSAVRIGLSRIPYAGVYGDFSATTTNEKHGAFNNSLDSSNVVVNVGRFAATLSGGAGYTWTVPTFNGSNLIQRPIYETRILKLTPNTGSFTLGNGTTLGEYRLFGNSCQIRCAIKLGSTTTVAMEDIKFGSIPFLAYSVNSGDGGLNRFPFTAQIHDTGTSKFTCNADVIFGGANDRLFDQYYNVNGLVTYNTPVVWATGDGLFVDGTYFY